MAGSRDRTASAPSGMRPRRGDVGNRPGWDDRHHLLFGPRVNNKCPKGQRDYFDRPRELRNVVPDGHDGLSTPYSLRPSLHWLKYTESPKMQKRSMSGNSTMSASMDMSLSPLKGEFSVDSISAGPSLAPGVPFGSTEELTFGASTSPGGTHRSKHIGVGSPPGSPTKPGFQKTGSWYLHPEKSTPTEKRAIKYTSTHYSEKHGTVKKLTPGGLQNQTVKWNNRWHLTPSRFNKLHSSYQEYFDQPSRMYTSMSEDWRHMYGEDCEPWTVRAPGLPFDTTNAYGWGGMRHWKMNESKSLGALNQTM